MGFNSGFKGLNIVPMLKQNYILFKSRYSDLNWS